VSKGSSAIITNKDKTNACSIPGQHVNFFY